LARSFTCRPRIGFDRKEGACRTAGGDLAENASLQAERTLDDEMNQVVRQQLVIARRWIFLGHWQAGSQDLDGIPTLS
jgi:hypothetical protein